MGPDDDDGPGELKAAGSSIIGQNTALLLKNLGSQDHMESQSVISIVNEKRISGPLDKRY